MAEPETSTRISQPTGIACIAFICLCVAGTLSFLASAFFAAKIDAGPDAGSIILAGVFFGCTLSVLGIWLSFSLKFRLVWAFWLSIVGSIGIYLSWWAGLEVNGHLHNTIGKLWPDFSVMIGPLGLTALVGVLVSSWKTISSLRLSLVSKYTILIVTWLIVAAITIGYSLSISSRFAEYRALRAQADPAVNSLRLMGLWAEWHPRYGLQVRGMFGRGVEPSLLNKVVPVVQHVPNIRLGLQGTPTRDEDLTQLAAIRHLESVDLQDTDVTDAGLRIVGSFAELRFLDLTGCHVTDAGLAQLAGMSSLQALYLRNSKVHPDRMRVTDNGVLLLKHCTGLQRLWVPKKVSETALRELSQHIPGLAISKDH